MWLLDSSSGSLQVNDWIVYLFVSIDRLLRIPLEINKWLKTIPTYLSVNLQAQKSRSVKYPPFSLYYE